jgi:hypothetical protein
VRNLYKVGGRKANTRVHGCSKTMACIRVQQVARMLKIYETRGGVSERPNKDGVIFNQ